MYVCLCKGITDTQIRAAVLNGNATSLRELRTQLGVSSECGQCTAQAKQILGDALAQTAAPLNSDLVHSTRQY